MLNQLLRFTLVSGALLWLRPRWKGLLALVVFVLLVLVLHGEYLSYVQLSGNDRFLVWSYAIKWFALVLGVAIYFFLAVFKGADGESSARTHKKTQQPAKGPVNDSAADVGKAEQQGDGFDFLRDKKHLESRAEKLLGRGKPH